MDVKVLKFLNMKKLCSYIFIYTTGFQAKIRLIILFIKILK